jgi:ornithine cyclodeaminase/alanine dehydrogenase-like protein (mu-crystallin family)
METTILTVEDIRVIVQNIGLDSLMDEMIERLELAFKKYDPRFVQIPARDGFSYKEPEMGLIEWMPLMHSGQEVMIKVVGYHPRNPGARSLPTILSTISTYDTRTGHLLGLADGVFLTALRTGAASAIASKYLTHSGSKIVGLIGCGAQAVSQLHALSRLFEIEEVFIYDIDPMISTSFVERVGFLELKVTPVDHFNLSIILESADILTTCTSVAVEKGPVFPDQGLKPWVHINAVGSDFPGKFEVPLSVLKRSVVIPDFLDQAIKEGESQQLSRDEIGPTITDILQNPSDDLPLRSRVTVFDSTGWALEDEVAIKLLLDHAVDMNLGTRVRLESIPEDPHDPYEFVRTDTVFGVSSR